jgi:hypothetical protein
MHSPSVRMHHALNTSPNRAVEWRCCKNAMAWLARPLFRSSLHWDTVFVKCWLAVMGFSTLAGCAGPSISVTDVSPHSIEFLVQNARLVPMQDVDEQGASHCQQHGLSYRRTDVMWVGPTSKRVVYECIRMEAQPALKPKIRRAPVRPARPAAAKPTSADPKIAAWTKAKAATDIWALCLRFDAQRKAKETTDAPQSVAQAVVGACSGLEHAVHEPLEAVGEDSNRFEADLHAQAVQNAIDIVTTVRNEGGRVGFTAAGISE